MGGAERCGGDIPELRLGVTQLETYRKHLTCGSVPLAGSQLEKDWELVTGIQIVGEGDVLERLG